MVPVLSCRRVCGCFFCCCYYCYLLCQVVQTVSTISLKHCLTCASCILIEFTLLDLSKGNSFTLHNGPCVYFWNQKLYYSWRVLNCTSQQSRLVDKTRLQSDPKTVTVDINDWMFFLLDCQYNQKMIQQCLLENKIILFRLVHRVQREEDSGSDSRRVSLTPGATISHLPVWIKLLTL